MSPDGRCTHSRCGTARAVRDMCVPLRVPLIGLKTTILRAATAEQKNQKIKAALEAAQGSEEKVDPPGDLALSYFRLFLRDRPTPFEPFFTVFFEQDTDY